MCGIFAITSNKRNNIGDILVECAEKLIELSVEKVEGHYLKACALVLGEPTDDDKAAAVDALAQALSIDPSIIDRAKSFGPLEELFQDDVYTTRLEEAKITETKPR